ncbi:putative DNA binding domain-containing protein [Paraburkholderia fungorum]|uniref:AlbA family DNA-binding domain-containing protein n=1 Tax=Paraburkholderia fungorum TaxID=134537 RepID=UPI0038BC471A
MKPIAETDFLHGGTMPPASFERLRRCPLAILNIKPNDMFPTTDNTVLLLKNLSESFSVEVKSWFDPTSPEGKSKLVKAAIALRNNNGGRLVIGFDDNTMAPVSEGRPEQLRSVFGQDAIQALVTKYASESFEVLVQYAERDGLEFPVICVPPGVKTPVATKGEVKDPATQKPVLLMNTVYVRTLASNNTVSTASAKWQDWERLCAHCFDNREADIGRFVRRHFDETMLSRLGTLLAGSMTPPEVDPSAVSAQFLEVGRAAFDSRAARDGRKLPEIGYLEIGAVVIGELREGLAPNRSMLNLIRSANRRFTGLPFFVTLDGAADGDRPRYLADGYEQMFVDLSGQWGNDIIDFWRIEPGRLYGIRGFDEDLSKDLKVARVLAITVQLWRVADALVEAVAIAAAMVPDPSASSLAITLRWSELDGRRLSNARSSRFFSGIGSRADDKTAISSLMLPLDLPDSALAQRTAQALAPLYRKFQGWEISERTIEEEVRELLSKTY